MYSSISPSIMKESNHSHFFKSFEDFMFWRGFHNRPFKLLDANRGTPTHKDTQTIKHFPPNIQKLKHFLAFEYNFCQPFYASGFHVSAFIIDALRGGKPAGTAKPNKFITRLGIKKPPFKAVLLKVLFFNPFYPALQA